MNLHSLEEFYHHQLGLHTTDENGGGGAVFLHICPGVWMFMRKILWFTAYIFPNCLNISGFKRLWTNTMLQMYTHCFVCVGFGFNI